MTQVGQTVTYFKEGNRVIALNGWSKRESSTQVLTDIRQ